MFAAKLGGRRARIVLFLIADDLFVREMVELHFLVLASSQWARAYFKIDSFKRGEVTSFLTKLSCTGTRSNIEPCALLAAELIAWYDKRRRRVSLGWLRLLA